MEASDASESTLSPSWDQGGFPLSDVAMMPHKQHGQASAVGTSPGGSLMYSDVMHSSASRQAFGYFPHSAISGGGGGGGGSRKGQHSNGKISKLGYLANTATLFS